ncbi:LapA family protein [Advenella sp. WQ 585]|uniref:LapA family protein n=1 Tax=Advenella mandrilli TaxID=2800330 RepID=A0ABS1EGJ0_9BURK|nr:LapA family protein [Advenella mandrilli]MBK1782126.1 LapA family protein [Advenella mandrilli]
MHYFIWALRLIIFLLVLLFALKNTQPVSVRFFSDVAVNNIPLIVVLLVTFFLGAVFAYLLAILARIKKTRQVGQLKSEIARLKKDVNATKGNKSEATGNLSAKTSDSTAITKI